MTKFIIPAKKIPLKPKGYVQWLDTMEAKYGEPYGPLFSVENQEKAKQSKIKKYGSLTGHLRTPRALAKSRETRKFNNSVKRSLGIPLIKVRTREKQENLSSKLN